jgi:repressor of nif and glnA expression
MQTITFTADDNVSRLLHDIAKENNKQTDEIIADSLRYYVEMLQRKKLSQQIRNASHLVANQSLEINQSIAESNADGL